MPRRLFRIVRAVTVDQCQVAGQVEYVPQPVWIPAADDNPEPTRAAYVPGDT